MADCIFCKIAEGEIPSEIVYSDEHCVAFRDVNPQAPTHILVIPREHIKSVNEINSENSSIIAHIFQVISKIAAEEGLEKGYRVVSNIGEDGQQSVPHLHFHIIGGRSLQWPPG